jgi:hypothetical protein
MNTIDTGSEPGDARTTQTKPEPASAEVRAALPLPGEIEDLIGQARDGVTALSTLWNACCIDPEEFPDQKFAASLLFCIDGIDRLLERADALIEDAFKAAREAKAAGPAAGSPADQP